MELKVKPRKSEAEAALERLDKNMHPAVRGDIARDVVSECRRVILGKIAAASRAKDNKQVKELEELKETFDRDFQLITGGHVPGQVRDKPITKEERNTAIERALKEHTLFLRKHHKGKAPKSDMTDKINGGPG